MDYLALKTLHQTAVILSFGGFFARGLAGLRGALWVRSRAARTLPHVIDTLLLASALTMVWMLRVNPLQLPWLMAKIVGLVAYIGLGMLALRPALPLRLRAAAWVAALLCFAHIASVALTKNQAGLLAWL